MTEVDTIIFYRSFYESISELDQDTQLDLYQAIFKFAFDREDTEFKGVPKAIFSLIKPLITANISNQKKGQKGGRPPKKEIDEEFVDDIAAEYQNIFGESKISAKNREKTVIKIRKARIPAFAAFFISCIFCTIRLMMMYIRQFQGRGSLKLI